MQDVHYFFYVPWLLCCSKSLMRKLKLYYFFVLQPWYLSNSRACFALCRCFADSPIHWYSSFIWLISIVYSTRAHLYIAFTSPSMGHWTIQLPEDEMRVVLPFAGHVLLWAQGIELRYSKWMGAISKVNNLKRTFGDCFIVNSWCSILFFHQHAKYPWIL